MYEICDLQQAFQAALEEEGGQFSLSQQVKAGKAAVLENEKDIKVRIIAEIQLNDICFYKIF